MQLKIKPNNSKRKAHPRLSGCKMKPLGYTLNPAKPFKVLFPLDPIITEIKDLRRQAGISHQSQLVSILLIGAKCDCDQ